MELVSTGKKVVVDVGTTGKRIVKRLVYRCVKDYTSFHRQGKLFIKVDSCWVELDNCDFIRWEK